MPSIKHLWFDFSETIATPNTERLDGLRYRTFANLKGVNVSEELRQEYNALLKKSGSNSNVFVQTFGVDGSFWPNQITKELGSGLYALMDADIPATLLKLSKILPVSVFSNIDTEAIMGSLGIDTNIFTNILSGSSSRYPKPHKEGYERIIELSELPAKEILYIGDLEQKDVIPAKLVGLKTGIIWNESVEADYTFHNFQEILDLFKA